MKILHVITSLKTGGAEKLMVDLLPRLRTKGIEADLCIFDGERTPFYQELDDQGIRIIDFGAGNSVYSFKNMFRLRKLMKEYDIVHTHNSSPQFFAAMANIGLGKTLVTTEHNTHNRRRNWPGFSIIDRWMYSRYKDVICISDKAEANLKEFLGTDDSSIHTIYNGVDIHRFASASPSEDLKPILPREGKAIIMVAAFRPQKDQDTLIKAMTRMPSSFHLFLVGEGERLEDCKLLSEAMGLSDRVHFLGRRSDIAELLKSSDFVVLSSHYEGLSLSSVEGMSVGKPFIASDVDGLHEVVTGAGILFPHQDAESLAKEILKLESNPQYYKDIAAACMERAEEFDISKMAQGYYDIYKSI